MLFTYDEKGRREYASGLTRREALSLLSQARGADVVIEKYAGLFEGMAIWKPTGVRK